MSCGGGGTSSSLEPSSKPRSEKRRKATGAERFASADDSRLYQIDVDGFAMSGSVRAVLRGLEIERVSAADAQS